MRKFLLLAFFILIGVSPLSASQVKEAETLFLQATDAYRAAKYDEAVRVGEDILSKGVESPAVYYNLANSYFKSGKTGKAVLNYIRARDLAPRDADIRANLGFTRVLVANGKFVSKPSRFSMMLLTDHLSAGELKWLAFFFFACAGAYVLVGYYMKFRSRRVMMGGFVLGLCWVFFLMGCVLKMVESSSRAVCVSVAEARFETSAQANVYFKLSEGAEVKILKEKDGWQKVQRSDEKIGWVPLKVTERI